MIPAPFLLEAYRTGMFPMGNREGGIDWYSPHQRGIIPIDGFHVPRRLSRLLRQHSFEIRINTAFREVIFACAALEDSWISREIRESYVHLYRIGFAHSVEAWQGAMLAGGLYGVSLHGAFFGESMFHRVTNASKAALVALVERLRDRGYLLLDTQWTTPHLERFGAIDIPRARYLRMLDESMQRECTFFP
jgi:leucyl/phenylalanyl-tRNA--protein transferase